MKFDKLLREIGGDNRPIEMTTTPARLFIFISQLQLALRHSENTGTSATIARQMAENMAEMLCTIHPEARELIDLGWNSAHDVSRKQFEAINTGELSEDEAMIANASNLLIEVSKRSGSPLILAANANMHHEEGLKSGNPAAADLEQVQGLTFAIGCNQFEAQFLINGINTLLAAMSQTIALLEDSSDQE